MRSLKNELRFLLAISPHLIKRISTILRWLLQESAVFLLLFVVPVCCVQQVVFLEITA